MNQGVYEIIRERNEYLSALFNRLGISDKIKMVGDMEKPSFVWNSCKTLSMYVKNFHLIFNDKPFGEEVHRVKLSYKTHIDAEWFDTWLVDAIHSKVFTIGMKVSDGCPPLYVSGFNYTDKESKLGQYPVFSHHDARIYFSKDLAIQIALKHDDYPLFVQ